jgi:hypothetical protein
MPNEMLNHVLKSLTLTNEEHSAISSLTCWWAMSQAHCELVGEPLKDDEIVLSFMGSGASTQVSTKDLRLVMDILTAIQVRAANLDVENNSPEWFAKPNKE